MGGPLLGTVVGRVDISNSATPSRYAAVFRMDDSFGPDSLARLDRSGRFGVQLPVGRYSFQGLSPIKTGYGARCAAGGRVQVSARAVAQVSYSCVLLHGVVLHGPLGVFAKTSG